jgi:hypothetical protein
MHILACLLRMLKSNCNEIVNPKILSYVAVKITLISSQGLRSDVLLSFGLLTMRLKIIKNNGYLVDNRRRPSISNKIIRPSTATVVARAGIEHDFLKLRYVI